ncbi:hypothetical protein [Nitrosopumilus sp.]|uniref:dioxygenase family protein n=1 Tax=Nitrosopumilus sp. TaxID=2024843 RepID=UPI0029311582|nr:hypothetical protein [Nitrosopumilus sp.]
MLLNKITVVAVPVITVLVLGSLLWQNSGMQNLDEYPCALTKDNAEGPYYIAGAPQKEKLGKSLEGQKLIISGHVLDYNCNPVPDAIIDVWQTDSNGKYYFDDFTLRGKIIVDGNGMYTLETIFPGKYSELGSFRPAHIHVKVSSPASPPLTTQLYFEYDEHHDLLVKPSLILDYDEDVNGIRHAEFDFVIPS